MRRLPWLVSLVYSLVALGSLAILLPAGAASALSGPKVSVSYSLNVTDGGRFDYHITQTPFGLSDVDLVITEEDDVGGVGGDESTEGDGRDCTPLRIVIEYTADPSTQEIIDGPVELSDLQFRKYFDVFAAGLSTTTRTDVQAILVRPGHGTLAGDTITWNNDVPMQFSTTGPTGCLGDEIVCTVGALNNPWPRIEDPAPQDQILPLFTVFSNGEFAARVVSDNGTPEAWTDDIISHSDPQAVIFDTWNGAEQGREFVPEPASLLLRGVGLAVIAVKRRSLRARRRTG